MQGLCEGGRKFAARDAGTQAIGGFNGNRKVPQGGGFTGDRQGRKERKEGGGIGNRKGRKERKGLAERGVELAGRGCWGCGACLKGRTPERGGVPNAQGEKPCSTKEPLNAQGAKTVLNRRTPERGVVRSGGAC